jgi:carbon storage regulator
MVRITKDLIGSVLGRMTMLVLSRKPGEKIVIGNSVTMTVLAVSGNKLRIGIEAPPQVCIRRAELGGGHDGSMGSDDHPDSIQEANSERFEASAVG